MQAQAIITPAQITLIDTTGEHWPVNELAGYVDEGQRQIAHLKRDAATRTIDHDLQPGIRQTLPDDGTLMVDALYNVPDGAAITAVDQRHLDRMAPGWSQTVDAVVQHYMYDARDRTTFYVYPAQPSNPGTIALRYAYRPGAIESPSDPVDLTGDYFSALLDYVLYRAHSKTTAAAVPQRAAAYYQQFMQALGGYEQAAQAATAGERERNGELR